MQLNPKAAGITPGQGGYCSRVMTPVGMKLGLEAARLLAAADCCEIDPGLTDAEHFWLRGFR